MRLAAALAASSIFFCSACISSAPGSAILEIPQKTEIEEPIRRKDLPQQVLMALPDMKGVKGNGKGYEEPGFTYKRKQKAGVITYDVYYEKGGDQFTINYDAQGRVLEEEKRIRFSDIPHDTRIKIEKTLSAHYPGYKVLMVEELCRGKETLLEIFFSHPDSKTGLVEAVFEFGTGALREFVDIRMKSISTFN